MKVDFNIPVRSFKGEPIKDKAGKDIPVKEVICRILSTITFGSDQEKVLLAGLSEKLWQSKGPVEITEQEAALIKDNIKGLPVVLFAQVYKMLEQ